MNSPNIRSEQLTPKMSPVMFSLDDNNSTVSSSFHSLLNSPTKLKLDSVGLYSTSLSKLNDYSRSGRSRNKSTKDTTLRSVSPIRFNNLFNAPKMLKPEYLKNNSNANASGTASTMPLLSALIRNNQASIEQKRKLGIKKTLESLKQQIPPIEMEAITVPKQRTPPPVQLPVVEEQENEEDKYQDKAHEADHRRPEPLALLQTQKIISEEFDNRIISNTSTIYSDSPCIEKLIDETDAFASNNVPVTNDMNFTTDTNGFIQYTNPNISKFQKANNNTNRYSFISSTSTDFDVDLFENNNQHIHIPIQQQQQQQPHTQANNTNQDYTHPINNNNNSNFGDQLDLKIKQLEVQIGELKLQNEKLINSISKNRLYEDKLLLEMLQKEKNTAISKMTNATLSENDCEDKKKLETYKKTLDKLSDSSSMISSKTNNSRSSDKSAKSNRISRISIQELQKFEESSDSANSSDNESDKCVKFNKYADVHYEADIDDVDNGTFNINTQPEQQQISNRRRGFQLNLHVQQ